MIAAAWRASAAPLEADVALMDRMIHKAQAEEVVVNATTAVDEPVALHRPSGMKCRFFLGAGDLQYFPERRATLCEMRRSTFGYALSAFPVQPADTPESVQSELRANLVKGRKTKDIPISKIESDFTTGDAGPLSYVSSRFQVGGDYWRVAVVRSGDWWITSAALSSRPADLMQVMLQAAEWGDLLKGLPAQTSR